MPTARTFWFLVAASVFYLFGNQTQIGWLYTFTALLLSCIGAAWLAGRGGIRGLRVTRTLNAGDQAAAPADDLVSLEAASTLHEGDTLTAVLTLHQPRAWPLAQLLVTETCPLADPASDYHRLRLYLPLVAGRASIRYSYTLPIYRRGAYTFPPVQLASRAPFGFFERAAQREAATACLVLPELRPLTALPLLDKQLAAQWTYPRAGLGSEILGTRPYRVGDSPRHIHWRSVARTGQLISKEFAEETQPGLTLILDRHSPHAFEYAEGVGLPGYTKHTPFELAIKCAASIADYALRRRFALYLLAAADDFALPGGALTLAILLHYLARVPAQPQAALPGLLASTAIQHYAAVILSTPDPALLTPLLALRQRGVQLLVVLPDPASFPPGGAAAQPLAGALQAAHIPVCLLAHGTDWASALSALE